LKRNVADFGGTADCQRREKRARRGDELKNIEHWLVRGREPLGDRREILKRAEQGGKS